MHSSNVAAPSGSSATPLTTGPTSRRCATSELTCSANAVMTPSMSFMRSQRDTCTTSGASAGGGGPVWSTSAWRSTRPGEPSSRVNATTGSGTGPSTNPTYRSTASATLGSIAWFLDENGSIDGGMTKSRDGSAHRGANAARVNTNPST